MSSQFSHIEVCIVSSYKSKLESDLYWLYQCQVSTIEHDAEDSSPDAMVSRQQNKYNGQLIAYKTCIA